MVGSWAPAGGLPAKFTGKDDDLLKAEMALNPVSNTAPPSEDDIGVGDDG